MTSTLNSHVEFIERRIFSPIDTRNISTIGLTQLAGTHGTNVESVYRLARDGHFSGGLGNIALANTFHITPNLRFKSWKNSIFAEDAERIVRGIGYKNPLEISIEYAEEKGEGGIVLGFDKRILPLVRILDTDEIREEPEVVLREAPPLEAVRAIYPVNKNALNILQNSLKNLR
jgi:hypothetical protein